MFSFFKKKNHIDHIEWLGVDIHSHILPGIDDGAKTLGESVTYIKKLQELGYSKLYCTPHIFTELYPNSGGTIYPALQNVQDALKAEHNSMVIGAAAEYMTDESFIVEEGLLCLPGNHLLIEMSYLSETPNIEQIIFDLQIKGYNIILAHPERYNFYHRNLSRYERLRDMGCILQLNLLSVTGYYGPQVKQAAEHLIKQKFYRVAGTDLHHEKHLKILEKSIRTGELHNLIGSYNFENKELFG